MNGFINRLITKNLSAENIVLPQGRSRYEPDSSISFQPIDQVYEPKRNQSNPEIESINLQADLQNLPNRKSKLNRDLAFNKNLNDNPSVTRESDTGISENNKLNPDSFREINFTQRSNAGLLNSITQNAQKKSETGHKSSSSEKLHDVENVREQRKSDETNLIHSTVPEKKPEPRKFLSNSTNQKSVSGHNENPWNDKFIPGNKSSVEEKEPSEIKGWSETLPYSSSRKRPPNETGNQEGIFRIFMWVNNLNRSEEYKKTATEVREQESTTIKVNIGRIEVRAIVQQNQK